MNKVVPDFDPFYPIDGTYCCPWPSPRVLDVTVFLLNIPAYYLLKLEKLSDMPEFLCLYLSGKGCHLKMFITTAARTIGRIM